MALYRHLQPLPAKKDNLPNPNGPLSSSISPATIKKGNEAVKSVMNRQRKRGNYAKFSSEQQAQIGEYASLNGNQAAVRHFSMKLGVQLKVTTIQTWKTRYLAEIARQRRAGEHGDLTVKSLPTKKCGRPLLLGDELDSQVQKYIQTVREGGGVITTSITMAAAEAIVKKADRNLLSENEGPVTITNNWAKSLLQRMNYVKRRGSSTAKMTVDNFEAVKDQFVFDVQAVVEMEEIPPELVFNWNQTGISIVPGSSWTMETKGSKRVEIAGMGDK